MGSAQTDHVCQLATCVAIFAAMMGSGCAGVPSGSVSVAEQVTSGDVVLVKGSRGTRTDIVVERLTAVFG